MATTATSLLQDLYSGSQDGAPVAWPAGAAGVTLNGLMSNQDALNTTLSCGVKILVSFDGGKTYSFAAGYTWMGGTARDGVSPGFPVLQVGYQAGESPTHAMARVEVPAGQSLSIGATLAFA